jgi:hypothetical protein
MLHVQLLGSFALQSGLRPLRSELGANGRRLASYLFSFPNRAHRRERLIDLILA